MIRTMFFKVGMLLSSILALGFMLRAIMKIVLRVCKFIYWVDCLNVLDDDDGGYLANNLLLLLSVILEMQIYLVNWLRNLGCLQICNTCKPFELFFVWLLRIMNCAWSRLYGRMFHCMLPIKNQKREENSQLISISILIFDAHRACFALYPL